MRSDLDSDYHDLTQSQQLLWTGQELNPNAPLYNMVFTFRIMGSVEVDTFNRAFNLMVAQSDALRSTFHTVDGVPKQHIKSELDGGLMFLDWSGSSGTDLNLDDWVAQHSQKLFDLSERCFESALIRLSSELYLWYFNLHHLITDAWGVAVHYNALARYYTLLKSGKQELPGMPKFRDYLEFERTSRSEAQFEQARSYWQEMIKNAPPAPHLYGNSRPVYTTASKRLLLDLGKQRSDKLRALAKQPDLKAWTDHLALFNIFATLVFAFLHRICGQQRIALGAPAHNRINKVFKETPGVFIEVFPIFMDPDQQESFSGLHGRVRDEVNGYLRHAMPGTTSAESNGTFQVVLNYIHAGFEEFGGLPVETEWVHSGHFDPGHQLRLQVHDFDASGSIRMHFDCNTQVFDEYQLQHITNHFLRLLDAFLTDRNQPIGKPQLIEDSEFRLLSEHLSAANLSDETRGTVLEQIHRFVLSEPDSTVLVQGDQQETYQSLDQKSNQLARYLINNKIGAGQNVVLMLNRSIELIIGILGVLKSGAAYVPIDSNFPKERVDFILGDLDGPLVLTNQNLAEKCGNANKLIVDREWDKINSLAVGPLSTAVAPESLAYIIYTSGTSGAPKGVMISHRALNHYIHWASDAYLNGKRWTFPLFTTPSFDLTVTSIFLPLVSGGRLVIYPETGNGPDLSLLEVVRDNLVDIIKLTPSHLGLLSQGLINDSGIKKMIIGGEDLKSGLAKDMMDWFGPDIAIYNEYGPTESTVGCVVHQFTSEDLKKASVPIGKPITNTRVYLLDSHLNPVPPGVVGEIYISGDGLAEGYWNRPDLNRERFIDCPFQPGAKMYASGDLGRLNRQRKLEYLGRMDRQVKIGGIRVELGEIEAALSRHPEIQQVAVMLQQQSHLQSEEVTHCIECGLPSNYPGVSFDAYGICSICQSFTSYQKQAGQYFRKEHELKKVIDNCIEGSKGEYDCLVLLSGGKDSTYALARLVNMGYKILAYTLDNGYISDQAKANINRVVKTLGVDHLFGTTEAMNAIFVDSLNRHCNVCNGCFKTIYTLSTNLAVEKEIPLVVTGLSRGQLFETRLTEELFKEQNVDAEKIDETILQARKAYHRTDDAVNRLLDVSVFEDEKVFEKVRYLDFYRYCHVELDQMLAYLDQYLPWVRPSDTGRSTNCTINQVGIYVHRKQKGYSNYAFPYSWDVRMGHKTRDAAIAEVNEEIDEKEVFRIMDEIGYRTFESSGDARQMVAYYVGQATVDQQEIGQLLAQYLPGYMIPNIITRLDEMPLTKNGKIDYRVLSRLYDQEDRIMSNYQPPSTQVEQMLAEMWEEVLQLPRVGILDSFIHLGGNSLAAIRLISRVNEAFHLDLPLNKIFEFPTISGFSELIEETITRLLESETSTD